MVLQGTDLEVLDTNTHHTFQICYCYVSFQVGWFYFDLRYFLSSYLQCSTETFSLKENIDMIWNKKRLQKKAWHVKLLTAKIPPSLEQLLKMRNKIRSNVQNVMWRWKWRYHHICSRIPVCCFRCGWSLKQSRMSQRQAGWGEMEKQDDFCVHGWWNPVPWQ